MKKKIIVLFISFVLVMDCLLAQPASSGSDEVYRPQVHFTPKAHWMNDPNGMVFHNGVYHLFFQYYPDASVWGPMHWGHATSKDMIHWDRQPIALYPDSLGCIFSGSAVVDANNTSGFGKNGKAPLVAIFTHHDFVGEKAKTNTFQNQSLAYSLDDGKTWIKYSGNPVLHNPGITDFRDPKVMWYEPKKKWIMTLATKDRITFYSSPDLKTWAKVSEFGQGIGAHGGVWECPDLFTLDYNGKKTWVLIVNLNPGGPNGGSATQYFLGDFDGNKFSPQNTETKWLDSGPDEYAGITWSNTGNRKIFLGWMSNWLYGNVVPTETWRSAMTIPRELKLVNTGNDLRITSIPVKELNVIQSSLKNLRNFTVSGKTDLGKKIPGIQFPCRLDLTTDLINDFTITLSNQIGNELKIGYDKENNQYFIDRSKSGKVNFQKEFAAKHTAPRFTGNKKMNLTLVIDVASVELFADDGLSVMTEIFFPDSPYNKISIESKSGVLFNKLTYCKLNSIWK